MSEPSKRIALLNEAARTLNRRGLSHTSLSSVAQSVGISRSALYYYVDDLCDLVYRCYRQTCEQLAGILTESCKKYDDEVDIICSFVATALDEGRPEFASISELAFIREDQRNGIVGLYRGLRLVLAEIISAGVQEGRIRPVAPQVTASIVLGLIFWVPVILRWPAARELKKSEFSATIQQIIRVGIARERAEPKSYKPIDFDPFISIAGNAFSAEMRAAARRETLLASASWLFNQKGVDATSLDEIAKRVGVSKKVIYHNVGNKTDLIGACYRRSFRLFEYISTEMTSYPGSRIDALSTGLASLAEANSRPDIAPLVPMTGHDTWPDDIQVELQASQDRLIQAHLAIYEQGHRENSLRLINEKTAIMVMPGIYDWMSQWQETLPQSEQEEAIDQIANFFRLGLSAL